MTKQLSVETWIGIASAGIAVAAGIGAYFAPDNFWQALLLNVAATFLGAAIAVAIVNVYLHRKERRKAVRSLLKLIAPPVEDYHNTFLQKGHDSFGRDHFGSLQERYVDGGGDPAIFTPDEREKIYNIVKHNKSTLDNQLERLNRELKDFAFMLGWSFDENILATAFDCRHSIIQMADLQFDDSEESKKIACELFLDAHIYSSQLYGGLVQIAQIPKDQVYTSRLR